VIVAALSWCSRTGKPPHGKNGLSLLPELFCSQLGGGGGGMDEQLGYTE